MKKCEICGKEFKGNRGLASHVTRFHKLSIRDYFIKYLNNGIVPVCYCGKETKFIGLPEGFQKHCSIKCSVNSEIVKEKKKQTCLKIYGEDNPSKSKEIQEKRKETNRDKFGAENAFQNEEIKEKGKETCKKKYGKEYASQNEKVKQKTKETWEKNYKLGHPLRDKRVQQKIKETNNDKFGCDNPMQNEKIKNKTFIKLKKQYLKNALDTFHKFGIQIVGKYVNYRIVTRFKCIKCNFEFEDEPFNVYCRSHKCPKCDPFCDSHFEVEVREEIIKYISSKLAGQFEIIYNGRKIIKPYEIDILIPELKISIEINGNYWHRFEKIEMRDIKKAKLMIKKGFKHFVIREFEWNQIRDYTFEKLEKILEIDFETYLENKSYFTGFELLDEEEEEKEGSKE